MVQGYALIHVETQRKLITFDIAELGKIKYRNKGITRTSKIVLSKETITELAIEMYSGFKQLTFKENVFDEKETGSYSSSSFSNTVPFSEHLFIVKGASSR
jgi:hypothetical protein